MSLFSNRPTMAGLLGLALALALAATATTVLADPAAENEAALRGLTAAELQALRDEQSRAAFQLQQQSLRDRDRATVGASQPRLDVPILQPNGQIRPSGNSYIK